MNYKKMMAKFDAIDTSLIADEKLRDQAIKLKGKRNQGGFTLLELLVVVSILAIVGGALISSFGGQETKAARGVATQVLAGMESAVRIYQASTDALPNNMESLACAPFDFASYITTPVLVNGPSPDTGGSATSAYKFGGTSNAPGIGGGMGLKLANKFDLIALNAEATAALNDAGVTQLRYAVTAACDGDATTTESVGPVFGATDAAFGGAGHFLINMDIPNHAFEDPRPNGTTALRNRGRGFSGTLAANAPVMVFNKGTNGYNNAKVGAAPEDILIGMGIGQASDLVGDGINAAFGKAPYYAQVGKDKYSHYVALVNIGTAGVGTGGFTAFDGANDSYLDEGNAFIQAILDARGDFLDEEIAEFSGQKL